MRPIVFVGPSIPLDLARRTLDADYRPPIRRGDLDDLGPGTLVGIIDGVFAQTLAISPDEIRDAIARGVVIYGASSMGALRAAEVPQVIGVGRIYEMYRDGVIERDDEVAVLFDPDTYLCVTEPLINVRYAVDRLVRSGTVNRETGNRIVESAARLHYTQRTYHSILADSPVALNRDANDLIRLLQTFNLKRDDAQFLLETLAQIKELPSVQSPAPASKHAEHVPHVQVRASEASDAPILIWESGDTIAFPDLIRFLKLTGRFEVHARNALARLALAGTPLRIPAHGFAGLDLQAVAGEAQELLDAKRLEWGWESPEEAHVTLRDLSLGLVDLSSALEAEVITRDVVTRFATSGSKVFAKAFRAELWLNDLALKREGLRLGALQYLSQLSAAGDPPGAEELAGARRAISRLLTTIKWSVTHAGLQELGVSEYEIETFVEMLARARGAARPFIGLLDGIARSARSATHELATARAERWRAAGLDFASSIKPDDTRRFSLSVSDAAVVADRIAKQMGIVRIGQIGQLDTLGIHVAQAFGERSGWSASFSSGKAETPEGARIGSIMEEAEIHAQDGFTPSDGIVTSYRAAPRSLPFLNPRNLDLPFDTRYTDDLELAWSSCVDLVSAETVYVPDACLVGERVAHDIYYSPRLGGKIFSSSGLGSGFTLAEAAVHAAAEVIERHAVRLAEIELDNPGGVGVRDFHFVDLETLPETPRRVVSKYEHAGMRVRILDITSEIRVPTFYARVYDDPFELSGSMSSDGFASHPDPEVAVTMALLEAAQTKAGVIAGGREDYSLQARSLGRHERPRTLLPDSQVFWFCDDRPMRPFWEISGFVTRDILEELEWITDRVVEAGYDRLLLLDLTMGRIRPAHAVRIIIPGVETTNPLFTGLRARVTLIRDLLPR